jgi:hypothetical protein
VPATPTENEPEKAEPDTLNEPVSLLPPRSQSIVIEQPLALTLGAQAPPLPLSPELPPEEELRSATARSGQAAPELAALVALVNVTLLVSVRLHVWLLEVLLPQALAAAPIKHATVNANFLDTIMILASSRLVPCRPG